MQHDHLKQNHKISNKSIQTIIMNMERLKTWNNKAKAYCAFFKGAKNK
jgi:hypothetical protein